MKIIILAASGATGRELTQQALERGHTVVAIVRDPARADFPVTLGLTVVKADVYEEDAIALALGENAIVLSGLGATERDKVGVLSTGARAVIAARPQRILWLGAYGTGVSAAAAGWATRAALSLMGPRLNDKVTADTTILAAGGTVFHAGPLSNGAVSSSRRTVGVESAPRRFFPARVSRATVAAAMLDEAESPRFRKLTAVPLER